MNKKTLLAALIVGATLTLPVISEAGVNLDVNIGPPVAQVEAVPPPPQVGYVWAPGYWGWVGGRHVWVAGHYMEPHPGAIWVPDHWVQRGPAYRFVPGHWRPMRRY